MRWIRPYGLAVASVATALALALLGQQLAQKDLEVPLFLMAIAITVWYTRAGPAALAIVLSSLAFDYFMTEPRYSFEIEPGEVASYVTFLLFAVLINWFVTKRRRVEQELRQALDELDTAAARTQQARLLNLTHDTIFVRDMSDVITYWNRGAEEFYGWTADELVGKITSHQLLHTVFPAPLEQINAELLRTGRWEGELVHTKRDGTQVVVASRWSREQDEQGRPLATLETNNDISERKRAEEELRKLNAELEQRVIERTDELKATNKELEAFAYSTSHDLRAPLRHVVGYSELLQKNAGPLLDDKSRRYVMMILESAKKMGALIVDDEKPLVALAEEILAKLGYEPVGFNTSGAALDAFREAPQRFDILLTDETMPELVGTDLAREIRLLRPDIPIVLMSGHSGAPLDERARAVGIREVLRKPLQSKDIAECFVRVLR